MDEENVLRSINNIYLNGVRIAALTEEGTAAYFLTDQVDSVAHILDDNAHTLSRMQYEPYGDTYVQRGSQDFNPKFNSQELDKESGFYFYNARYYDASIARFTSADTIIDGAGDTQGWNRYAYVKGNPIGLKDPTGHEGGNFNNYPSSAWRLIGNLTREITKEERINAIRAEDDLSTGMGRMAAVSKTMLPGHVTDVFMQSYADHLEKDYGKLGKRLGIEGALAGVGVGLPYVSAAAVKAGKAAIPAVKAFLKNSSRSGIKISSQGGKVRQFEQEADKVYYRVFSGDKTKGDWLTSVKPKSSAWAQEGLSLPPGNKADFYQEVFVPKGTLLERSRAAAIPEWNRFRGGAEQFELLNGLPEGGYYGPAIPFK